MPLMAFSRLDTAEERISELGHICTETSKTKKQREKYGGEITQKGIPKTSGAIIKVHHILPLLSMQIAPSAPWQSVPCSNSSSAQPLSHTCFPASACVTVCSLSTGDCISSSSASGASQVRSGPARKGFGAGVSTLASSRVAGPFLISVTRAMTFLFSAEGSSFTSLCLGDLCLLHRLRQNCSSERSTKRKARWKRSRAKRTLVFLESPSRFPSLSSLLKELRSKAMKRLSTWGGGAVGAQAEWTI